MSTLPPAVSLALGNALADLLNKTMAETGLPAATLVCDAHSSIVAMMARHCGNDRAAVDCQAVSESLRLHASPAVIAVLDQLQAEVRANPPRPTNDPARPPRFDA